MHTIEESIEVAVPVQTAYNQWTQFESIPRASWRAWSASRQISPTRTHLRWVAETAGQPGNAMPRSRSNCPTTGSPGRRSVEKAHAGVVTFHRLDDQRCKIMVQLDWDAEGVVERVGSALGQDTRQVKTDLTRFKTLIESRGSESGGWRGVVEQGETAR